MGLSDGIATISRLLCYYHLAMLEPFVLALPLLLTNPGNDLSFLPENLPYLPEDLCVDFTEPVPAFDPNCPRYYFVSPRAGIYSPEALPRTINYEFAVLINEALDRDLIQLMKKSSPERTIR